MTLKEATEQRDRLNKHKEFSARLVRILPAHIDPIQDDDNGWDVEITVLEDTA